MSNPFGVASVDAGNNDIEHGGDNPAVALEAGGGEKKPISLTEAIRKLKEEQKQLRDAKKTVSKTLKNAVRRKSRLQRRARQLSELDLIEVLRMRSDKPLPEVSEAPPAPQESQPGA
jgi:hypothetical protein